MRASLSKGHVISPGDCRIDYSDSKWLADTLVWLAWSTAEL